MFLLGGIGCIFFKKLHGLAAAGEFTSSTMQYFHNVSANHAFVNFMNLGHFSFLSLMMDG
jgi:hypothetical protein